MKIHGGSRVGSEGSSDLILEVNIGDGEAFLSDSTTDSIGSDCWVMTDEGEEEGSKSSRRCCWGSEECVENARGSSGSSEGEKCFDLHSSDAEKCLSENV